jgi:hypothetical protein
MSIPKAQKPFRVWRTGPAGPLFPFKRYRDDQRFLAIDLSPAANEARVEQVAKVLRKRRHVYSIYETWEMITARAALSALHKKLGGKE